MISHQRQFFITSLLSLAFIGVVLIYSQTQAASGEKFDLIIYPSVWTVTNSSSGSNMIAVRGKAGFTGNVSLTVSGLPSTLVDHYPNAQEFSEGKGGYYCTDHCQAAPNADFPMSISVNDGQWTSVGPSLLIGPAATLETKTVTITATGGGTSVSQSFTLKVINDSFQMPEGGGPPTQAGVANPNGLVTINNAEWGVNTYKINLTAGQSQSVNVDVVNNESGGATLQLLSVLTGAGVTDVNSSVTGGFSSSSVSLAAGERRTLPFTITTQSTSLNGTYEFIMGVAQADGSNRATIGISTIVTGGASGATPTTSAPTTSAPSTTSAPLTTSTTTQSAVVTTTASPSSSTSVSPSPSESVSPTPSESISSTAVTTVSPSSQASQSTTTDAQPSTSTFIPTQVLAQTVSQEVLVPAAVTGAVVAAATFATTVVPMSALSTGIGLTATVSTYLLMIWNALLEGVGLRRRRYPWGTVFETQSDQPLELAIVRLKTAEGRLIETRVTDRMGRFGFLAHPGTYILEAMKNGYQIATAISARGSRFQPVLTSPSIVIGKDEAAIRVNVPMSSVISNKQTWLPVRRWLGVLHRPALFISVPVSLGNYLILPSTLNLVVVALLALIIASEWLILTPRFFGLVTGADHRPVPGLVLQLVRADDRKVVDTHVTDELGRYSFLVRPGSYQIRVNSGAWRGPSWLETTTFTIKNMSGGVIDRWIRVSPAVTKDAQ